MFFTGRGHTRDHRQAGPWPRWQPRGRHASTGPRGSLTMVKALAGGSGDDGAAVLWLAGARRLHHEVLLDTGYSMDNTTT